MFRIEEFGVPRYTELSYLYRTLAFIWWYDATKVSAIDAAKARKSDIAGPKTILENRFWKNLRD